MTIRVAIVEDQRLVRDLLAELLHHTGCDVVGAACSGLEALAMLSALPDIDVVVLDVGLPDMTGVAVARRLHASMPHTRILALSVHDSPDVVREMLDAGASGYVTKSAGPREVIAAIDQLVKDGIYLPPELTAKLRHSGGRRRFKPAPRLGRRERQILCLVAEGKRTPDIAAQLGISQATVEAHRRNIMEKLDLHTIAELTRYAVREGLSSL